MLLIVLFYIALAIVLAIQALFTLIPIGNERSTVRRLPWVTFGIMAACVVIYYVTLPSTVDQEQRLMKARDHIAEYLDQNQHMLADEKIREKLEEVGLFSKDDSESYEKQLNADPDLKSQYDSWLRGAEATKLRNEFDKIIKEYKEAAESNLYYRYGLAPNGEWKVYQLLTAMFLHGSTLHLFGNLIFFFAVGFSLEDLWGRGPFLAFYLLAGVAACIPDLIHPGPLPMVGASGAISGTMGAFLIRLYNTKVKIAWVTMPLGMLFLIFGKKPFGVINIAAYIFLPFYFICQVLPWWFFNKAGLVSGVAYSAHIAGFLFGVAFALMMKGSKAEELYINPKIEAKVSFAAAPVVTQALDLLDKGDIELAERKLKAHIIKFPNDPDTILALIQVYQRTMNLDQLNAMYGRLIRHHLANNDKEAALYSYDNLLSAFPDDQIAPRIAIQDWLTICDYLLEAEMNREAAVEYERLAKAYPDNKLATRACVQGGEAALAVHDNKRALTLFEMGKALDPQGPLGFRIETGLEKCRKRLEFRNTWAPPPAKPAEKPQDLQKQKLPV